MLVNLKVNIAEEYFLALGREINCNDDSQLVWEEMKLIDEILACEISIFLLRRASGVDGSIIDNMITIRRRLIDSYESTYEEYSEFNDFY